MQDSPVMPKYPPEVLGERTRSMGRPEMGFLGLMA